MKFLTGLTVLLAFLLLGNTVVDALKWPFPGSVVGMVLLWGALSLGWVKPAWVEGTSTSLLSVLGLLFVPAGAGILLYFTDGMVLLKLLGAVVLVLMVVAPLTGHLTQLLLKGKKHD